ncbi:MAG: hypothetical protein HRT64_02785 [Erythrobacter sp.]|nr:hypothetical protein [Erythrobacter sp.]
MNRILFTIAAAAGAAVLAVPAHAQIKTNELEKAYLKGKKNSRVGQQTMREELRCFIHYTVLAGMATGYPINLAKAHGELGYGYASMQFNHYALRWSQHSQGSPGYRETFLSVLDEVEGRNYEKKKELKRFGTEIGQCAIPINRLVMTSTELGRAETLLQRVGNQPYQDAYPEWVKNRQAWDNYGTQMRKGNVLGASEIVVANMDSGDTSTFHENEYLAAVEALVDLGQPEKLAQSAYKRAAFMKPEKFATLAGYDPADFRPQFVPYKASSSRLGSMAAGTAARNTAESLVRDKCERAGGKVYRVNSVPTESYKATETTWRTTYEATAQCEFPPKLGG